MGAVQAGWGEDDFASLARHYAYAGSVKDLPLSPAAASSASSPPVVRGGSEEALRVAKAVKGETLPPWKKTFFGLFGRSGSDSKATA